jgi:hypothetical protein
VRVVNHRKWRQAKIKVLAACFFGALWCGGGLEGAGTDKAPSIPAFIGLIGLSFWLLQNVSRPLPSETARDEFVRRMRSLRRSSDQQTI